MTNDNYRSNAERWKRLEQLEKTLRKKEAERKASVKKLSSMERAYDEINKSKIWQAPHQIKRSIRSSGAYVLGRRNRKELYSKAYRRKKAANELKKYTYHLYDLGFTEKALQDIEKLYQEATNKYIKQASAWELALYYANTYTVDGAALALTYIQGAKQGETDREMLRKITIIEAECLMQVGEQEAAVQLLKAALNEQMHPDLSLALANTTEAIDEKTEWINQALDFYHLPKIAFQGPSYDDLTTVPLDRKSSAGPKVSVIIPAYNAADGIGTAIESIREQTWENLEILVVDDCSTDNTREVVKSYVEKDSRIKLLSTLENSGAYTARNIALQAATGEFVTINDSDDWSHAVKIETQTQHLLDHPHVVANTSEHARLTEELNFYRRGRPGSYIFTNMSSLMFRREPVLEKIGYWDEVRFAADSEFIRRMMKAFGKGRIIHLHTGPLSLPRQSTASLTGSSKFGYNGFLMGARKEYSEAQRYYHEHADTLYYPANPKQRSFPVPAPMWTKRKTSLHFDVVIAADFRAADEITVKEIKANVKKGLRTGLIQMAEYDVQQKPKKMIGPIFRKLINGDTVQMLVYGEKITCEVLTIKNPNILKEKQKYIPNVMAHRINVVITKLPRAGDLRMAARNMASVFGKTGKWYPVSSEQRKTLTANFQTDVRSIKLASKNWPRDEEAYLSLLENWLVEENPYVKGGS